MHMPRDRMMTGLRRLLGGMGLLVFVGAFFVVPLYASLALCAMPCCSETSESPSVSSDAMAACQTECSTRADAAASTDVLSVMPEGGPNRLAAGTAAVALVIDPPAAPAATARQAIGSGHGLDAPLHLLNSTFRI